MSDAGICANLSANILDQGGSAVDAAITAMLCNGVVQGESSGLGGGGFMTIRLQNGSVYTINFRETAPSASTEDMFHSNASVAQKVSGGREGGCIEGGCIEGGRECVEGGREGVLREGGRVY